jgi:hypothetical protein
MADRQTLSPLLLGVPDTAVLQQLCRDHETEEGVNYNRYERLEGPVETLKDFVEFLTREEVIWIAEQGSFVSLVEQGHPELPESYQNFRLRLVLRSQTIDCVYVVEIHASTTHNASACLEFLVGLPDSWFTDEDIEQNNVNDRDNETCRLTTHQLGRMLQNSKRRTGFWSMVFTAEHCRALATCGVKPELKFYGCSCEDDGARFVRSYAEGNGPRKLVFAGSPVVSKPTEPARVRTTH